MRRVLAGCLAAVLAVASPVGASRAWADEPADPVVAQRGSVTLTASQVRQLIQMADPELRRQMEHDPAVLAEKVRERLLQLAVLKEAQDHDWDKKPEIAFRAELAKQNAIVETYVASQVQPDPAFPSDDQIQAAYDANKSKLMLPRQYHLAQIFVAAPQSAGAAADAEALRRINDLRAQVMKPHGDFAAVAKKSSDDKASAPNGGDLGWVREDGVIPPIRSVVAGLPEGSISDPIRSTEGWHLVKVIGTRPAAPATLAEARDTLVRALRQDRQVQGQRNFVTGLLKQEPIRVNEIEVGKLILAQ